MNLARSLPLRAQGSLIRMSEAARTLGYSSGMQTRHSPRIPSAVWALGFVSLLMDVSSEMVHALLPVFLVGTLGASAWLLGLIEGLGEATALVVKMFSGALSDYLGRRKPLAVFGYGLGALSKPLFALASGPGLVLAARVIDRVGKGLRGAPRDALVADLTPPALRGAAFGLRQSLDTVGAFTGPLLAIALMLLWDNQLRAVFAVAIVPGLLAVLLLQLAVREPAPTLAAPRRNPLSRTQLRRLPAAFWWVVLIGVALTLARFSEAFLILRLSEGGLALAYAPLVLVLMNAVYALSAYPFGWLSDRLAHAQLLALGVLLLIVAELLLARAGQGALAWTGIACWGLHMGMTQGLLARMVADSAPPDLRGTAFGFFNLCSGLAMLPSSLIAGLLWDHYGAPQTFAAGALFCLLSLALLLLRRRA